MTQLLHAALDELTPLVGTPAATLCIYGAAQSVGISATCLTKAEMSVVADRIRTDMRSFAPPDVLEGVISRIEFRVSQV